MNIYSSKGVFQNIVSLFSNAGLVFSVIIAALRKQY